MEEVRYLKRKMNVRECYMALIHLLNGLWIKASYIHHLHHHIHRPNNRIVNNEVRTLDI